MIKIMVLPDQLLLKIRVLDCTLRSNDALKVITNVSQLQYESDSWKRMIEFIILDNAYSKNRLSEVIKNSSGDNVFLEFAEFYQNRFIQQETHLSLVRNDIYSFDRLLEREKSGDGILIKEVLPTRKRIKFEIEKLLMQFNKSKKQFDNFLEANSL